jgi:uncharacterized protein
MNGGRGDQPAGGGPRPCPICGRPADARLRPFCSRRCADVDLHRWLSESYRIPVVEDDEDDGGAADGENGAGDRSDDGNGAA